METEYKDIYKEKKMHGDVYFPLAVYKNSWHRKDELLQYHWHKEIEIIYVEEGLY